MLAGRGVFLLALGLQWAAQVSCASLTGSVRADISGWNVDQVHVALFSLDLRALPGLTKRRLLGAEIAQLLREPPTELVVEAIAAVKGHEWSYTFQELPPGNYTAVAFQPAATDRGNWLDFAPPRRQPLGFYQDEDGCPEVAAWSALVCSKVVKVTEKSNMSGIDIVLRAPHLMPPDQTVEHGSIRGLNQSGVQIAVLHVKGSAYERGFAHGQILGRQIIDFFDFFLLEDMVRSKHFYSTEFLPALRRLVRLTPEFQDGAKGILAGMRAANYSMRTSLGRDLDFYDIVALNAYSEGPTWAYPAGANMFGTRRSSCTQFIFWGNAAAAELAGGTIAGRNMDEENDVRKLTVNNILIHAVEPSEAGFQKYVHVMWPGFVGTSSGFTEQGRYIMENSGCSPPGATPQQSPIMRDVISHMLLNRSLSPHAGAEELEAAILDHRSEGGGTCTNGAILVFAGPHKPEAGNSPTHPGLIYECDRHGGEFRHAAEALPTALARGIMATNHYLRYNVVPGHTERCNGVPAELSSLARYFAGQNKVEAWQRAGELSVGRDEMRELLQSVAHGTTEHSVIFRPNEMKFEIAVASPNGVWDAPYLPWAEFTFDAMFDSPVVAEKGLSTSSSTSATSSIII